MPKTSLILSKPPVVETVLTVQFSDLPNWKSIHHGLYYEHIRDKYPEFEQIAEIPPIIESFPPVPRRMMLEFRSRVDEGCASYTSQKKTELVRVQKNRFAYHWIGSEDGTYPHFTENSKIWSSEFEGFLQFCDKENVGEVVPVLCEVQYLNHIYPAPDENLAQTMVRVFGLALGEFELTTLNRTYVLGDNQGRLYAEIQSAFDESGKAFLEFKLTCRIRHEDEVLFTTMQIAHDFLISHFKQLTVDETRKIDWGSNEK